MLQKTSAYSGWKKSCTTLDGWNPINNGINHLSTGAGFRNRPQYHKTPPGLGNVQLRDQSAAHARAHVQHAARFPDHGTGLRLEGLWRRWMAMGGNSFYGKSHGNHMEITWNCAMKFMGNWCFFFYFSTFYACSRGGKNKKSLCPRLAMKWPILVSALASQKVRLTHSKKNVIETIEFWGLNNFVIVNWDLLKGQRRVKIEIG